jgi:F0F1-type ATP synthase epsilon subunit
MSFKFRLLTQAGLITEMQASSVTLKGADGELGIFENHADYVGVLGNGILTVTPSDSGKNPMKFKTSGGLCQVHGGNLEVLADTVLE